MSGRWLSLLVLLGSAGGAGPGRAASIYEVPESVGDVVGAWDGNILADDVHFETASIIRMVRLRLAIAGEQTCTLWLFDALGSAPLHSVVFTNVPATNEFHVSTYDIEMHVQVPKDIYIGFSAQGGGWGVNAVDYWSRGGVVNRGVAGTAGQYYFGPVSGGQLTTAFSSGDGSYACMQVLSEPVRVEAAGLATGHVHLAIGELPIYATNSVERSATADGTNWTERGLLPAGEESATWSESNSAPTSSFYRVKSR